MDLLKAIIQFISPIAALLLILIAVIGTLRGN